MKRLPGILIVAFFMVFIPVTGTAQTPEPRPVAVMPFTGETDAINTQFRNSVSAEMSKLDGNFPPDLQTIPSEISPEDLPSDEPPPAYMVGGIQYALTGASFPDNGEHHLQIWLWDVEEPTLIYTDELVCEEVPNGEEEFVGLLVDWVFSHVPDPPEDIDYYQDEPEEPVVSSAPSLEPVIEDTIAVPRGQRPQAPVFEDEDKWFYIGGRLGGSLRLYNADEALFGSGNIDISQPRLAPAFEGGLHGSLQMLPFLSLQVETLFTMDTASFMPQSSGKQYNVTYTFYSFMLPVLLKFTFRPIPFLIAPFGGAYFVLPLGKLKIDDGRPGAESKDTDYKRTLAFGWVAGINLGMQMSQFKKGLPGTLFADIRYAADMSPVRYQQRANDITYQNAFGRGMVSLTIGYEIGLLNRDIKTVKR